MNMWNLKDLPFPPVCTYLSNYNNIDVQQFHCQCNDFKNFLTFPQLQSEFCLLSRIVYRMKQKFRTAKDFKMIEKLNKALQRYFGLNLSSDLQVLLDLIPDNQTSYMPTKNLVNYILVRLQGKSKLIQYIMETCIDIADMLKIRIQTGHFWKIGFILFSIVSRIFVLSRHNLKKICEFYIQLSSMSSKLQNTGKQWLPEKYSLPQNLETWLGIDLETVNKETQIMKKPTSDEPNIFHYFDLCGRSDSENEFIDEYIYLSDDEGENNSELLFTGIRNKDSLKNEQSLRTSPLDSKLFSSNDDVGELVETKINQQDELNTRILGNKKNREWKKILHNTGNNEPLLKTSLSRNQAMSRNTLQIKLATKRKSRNKLKKKKKT